MDRRGRLHRVAVVTALSLVALLLAACQGVPVTGQQPAAETPPAAQATQPVSPTQPMAEATAAAVTPLVEVEDQSADGGSVTIARVVSDGPGWLVIHADNGGNPGAVLGYAPVQAGENQNVRVTLDDSEATAQLHAMLHVDAGEAGVYEFPGADVPATANGAMVSPVFQVSGGSSESSGSSGGDDYGSGGMDDNKDSGELDVELEISETAELGRFLVDGEGMTLYLFTRDEPGVSNCAGDCLVNWPPVLVDSPDAVEAKDGVDPAKVGTIPFEGGKYLVTYEDMPLYYWINDGQPGDTTGQGVGGVWYVVEP